MNKKLSVIMLSVFIFSFAVNAEDKHSRDEVIVSPSVSLIDIPTAGVLDYSNFAVKTRFYNNGGVLAYMNVGVLNRMNLGASFMVDRLIGSQSPVKFIRPEIQVKFRFYDGGYYLPAMALGYDGQGYYYDSKREEFMQKGKGLYLVGSKEVLLPNLMGNLGFNVPDFDDGYLYSFIGFDYNFEDKMTLILEYDNLFHSDYHSRFNLGVRVDITPNFGLDLALRNIGRNSRFPNGEKDKMERIVQLSTSFYLGSF
ncbi:MAG: YjbH domain-containing protein [Elusimicrobia bacterium]|nr:YjbH domain-containing protein [Elusimicrobiota bacterium]